MTLIKAGSRLTKQVVYDIIITGLELNEDVVPDVYKQLTGQEIQRTKTGDYIVVREGE